MAFMINLFRESTGEKESDAPISEEKEQQNVITLQVFEMLLDIAHKEIRPIMLIKKTGSDFIIPLYLPLL